MKTDDFITIAKRAIIVSSILLLTLMLYHFDQRSQLIKQHEKTAEAVVAGLPPQKAKMLSPIVFELSVEEVAKWLDAREAERQAGNARSLAWLLLAAMTLWVLLDFWGWWQNRDNRLYAQARDALNNKDFQKSIKLSEKLSSRHHRRSGQRARGYEALGWAVQASALHQDGQFERSLDLCVRLVSEDVEKDLPSSERSVSALTMRVKSTNEFYLGRYPDTIATLNELVAKFSYSVEPGIIASAHYNIACAHARLGEVGETVKSLRKWAEVGGQFDSDVIAQDSDFDGVRQHAVFRKLIRSFDPK